MEAGSYLDWAYKACIMEGLSLILYILTGRLFHLIVILVIIFGSIGFLLVILSFIDIEGKEKKK
jgi:hypothetical protein